uniref:Uncharacterized protein n=1 Tax=Romanomermis culicivorax TaxID=13658 RepID=A0A915IXN6_ROMCU
MEVGISFQAEPEIRGDNEFAETVVDVETWAKNYAINLYAEQLKLISAMMKKCCWMMHKKTLQHNNKNGHFESIGNLN